MIEKIKNLKWYYQLLMLVVVGGLMYTGVWYFVTSATRAETEVLNQQVSTLTAKNHAAEIAVEHINEFRALFASKQQEYDELKVLLPEQREITNVLQGLQDTARDSKMVVMRFSPRDDTLQDSMTAKPVEIEVDKEKAADWPGVGIEVVSVREYPTGGLTSEIIGFLGPLPQGQEEYDCYKNANLDKEKDKVGYGGIEAFLQRKGYSDIKELIGLAHEMV
jgi:cell division protein FtsI/penicillin-binding protein 2